MVLCLKCCFTKKYKNIILNYFYYFITYLKNYLYLINYLLNFFFKCNPILNSFKIINKFIKIIIINLDFYYNF